MNENNWRMISGVGVNSYLIYGRGLFYLKYVVFYKKIRFFLEKLYLYYSLVVLKKSKVVDNNLVQVLSELFCYSVMSPTFSACLLYTAWYKPTYFVGCVGDKHLLFFVKFFKKLSSAQYEYDCNVKLIRLYGDIFTVPRVVDKVGRLLVFEFWPRIGEVNFNDIVDKISVFIVDNASRGKYEVVQIDSVVSVYSDCIQKYSEQTLDDSNRLMSSLKINAFLSKYSKIYFVSTVHGDMTPWNIYISNDFNVVLVDSERLSTRSIYTDLLHFLVQREAMSARSGLAVIEVCNYLSLRANVSFECAIFYVTIYLLEEICIDLCDLFKTKENKILLRALKRKMLWLHEITSM